MGYFSSLSKSATASALFLSELAVLVFGVVLVVGLIGEFKESWKAKRWPKAFELMVIIGVAGELLADGGVFLFSEHLQTISEREIATLNTENERLRPRHLTPEQRTILVTNSKNGPTADVEMLCALSSADNACEFADEIRSALIQAGWPARDVIQAAYLPVPVGIEVVQRNKGQGYPPMRALIEALGAAGLKPTPLFDTQGTLPESTIRIFVGTKP